MTEPLDAELLKDLRGMGKPPSFDGNGTECQDSRLSFRIHMSLVSAVSQTLMGKCGIERNLISLVAAKATPEVLRTDVLFVGFDNERHCPDSCPIC